MLEDRTITLVSGGSQITGWTKLSIEKSIEKLSPSFSFSFVDKDIFYDSVQPEQPVSLYYESEKIVTGYIDSIDPSIDDGGFYSDVKGRTKTCDIVDCSAENDGGRWNNISPVTVVSELCKPFGITVKSTLANITPIKCFTIDTGETVFEAISRICGACNAIPVTDSEGNLVLTNATLSETTWDSLEYGKNIISAGYSLDYTNRFSDYTVKGQITVTSGFSDAKLTIKGTAKDSAITRHRPLQIKPDDQITQGLANSRAAWEAQVRMGRSRRLSVVVPGWLQSDQTLWDVNMMAMVIIPRLRINTKLLITTLRFEYDNNGKFTSMELADPNSFAPQPKHLVKETVQKGPFS